MNVYHVGSIFPRRYLFLMKLDSSLFQWFKVNSSFEREEEAIPSGETPAKAIFAAHKQWKNDHFRLLNCGFRYSLPVRDETGCNAFFWEMAKSYASPNGSYFDEELGHFCYVDFASQEALSIWRAIR